MSIYAVTYTYSDDQAGLDRIRPAHREFLGELADLGVIVASGPHPGSQPATALLVVSAESEERVGELLDADPFMVNGLIAERRVLAWNPLIGQLAHLA